MASSIDDHEQLRDAGVKELQEQGIELPRRSPVRAVLRKVITPDVRYRLHQFLVENRWIAERYVAADPMMAVSRVTDDTRLVIDGFGRSANTYASAAFALVNGHDVPVASHRHAASLIEEGVRRGLPTIVLIRRPRAAIASGLQYTPGISLASAIKAWERYYTRILPLLDDVMVVTFDEAIADFGAVTARCNARFGSDFALYEKTPEAEAAVLHSINSVTAVLASAEVAEQMAPRPSAKRQTAEEFLASVDPKLDAALDRLDALYDRVVGPR